METVTSHSEFLAKTKDMDRSFLLLYKNKSELCDCAMQNLTELTLNKPEMPVFIADVGNARDIHQQYSIDSVPSLLIFENGQFANVVKGCQHRSFYKSLLDNALYQDKAKSEGKEMKRVTVYSTPTCPWCNTLKAWLRKNNIRFTDVDVSRDQHAAEELVRRTGQQGVPQTDINGQIVVGFNQPRLKELLEIK
jgi:glutaredoxin-like YruB-family protein